MWLNSLTLALRHCCLLCFQRKLTDVQLVLQEWRDYNRDCPREISCMVVMPCGGPLVLPGAYVGDDCEGEGKRLVAELVKIGKPMINTYKVAPYCDGPKIGADLQSSAVEHQPSVTRHTARCARAESSLVTLI